MSSVAMKTARKVGLTGSFFFGLAVFGTSLSQAAVSAPPHVVAAVTPEGSLQSRLSKLVEEHVAAQAAFDQKKLRELTATEYLEISPRGELDPRSQMLSFYEHRPAAASPNVSIQLRSIRHYGPVGILVATLAMGPSSSPRVMQASYTARCSPSACKLLTVQYTPVR